MKKTLAKIFIVSIVLVSVSSMGFAADLKTPDKPALPKIKPAADTRTRKPDIKRIAYVVQGRITDQNGAAKAGLTVKASDRTAGVADKPLGQAMTDSAGHYAISYTLAQIGDKKTAPDLVVSVYQGTTLLSTSDVIFNAEPSETRDFIISGTTQPEFQRLKDKVKPLLRGN